MEHNKYSNQNQYNFSLGEIQRKYPLLYFILIVTLILIILFIIYLIEEIIFIILTTITFTPIISIPLLIFLHLLLIRYLILQVAFSGQNLIASRSILYSIGKISATTVFKSINSLHDSLSILNDKSGFLINNKDLSEIKKQLNLMRSIINYNLDILSRMKNKFNKLTNDQELFFNNILSLNDSLNNANLIAFINNTINTIKNHSKESLSDIPDEEINIILTELSSRELRIKKIIEICQKIIDQIMDYLGDNYLCINYRYLRNFFKNNLFASIEQLHCELNNYYKFEENNFTTKDNCKLEYIIFRRNLEKPKKKLMIICGPNGVPFQIFSRNFRFENYLEMNMDVLCWNYRGYGLSKGKPSYAKLRTDILELFDEVKKNYNYEKYAVHGISIGGIPCCHLASNRKEIELMICDRNFGRLDNITQSFPCGKFLFFLYKLFFFQSTDNVDNYLNVKCYKIILNDPKDSIVLDSCSLKTLISAKLCEKYFDYNSEENNPSNNNSTLGSSNNYELESLSTNKKSINNNQNIPLTTLNDKISVNNYNKDNNNKILIKKTALDKILNSVEEKNKFVNLLIKISNIIKNDKFEVKPTGNLLTNITSKFKKDQYSNLNEEELQNTNGIFDSVKTHMEDIFYTVESSGDTLFTLKSIKRDYTKAIYIDNFFNNMFIWGSKFTNDKNNENNLHSTKNIKKMLSESIILYEEFLNSQEIINFKELTLIKDIENLYKYFIQIQTNLKYVGFNTKEGFVKLINDDLIDDNDYEQCLIKVNIGNYVPLSCGHNGALSSEENELFQNYLNKSSFIIDKNEENIEDNINDKIEEDNEDINTRSFGSDKKINKII